ncbi:PREDICTED: leucine-rich repeat-containing protein 56, partial [Pterocles gutturalis]|uniref:leucine-rich repeat-containing protein 56 n=1 Tax=Pterocles gutturalis TaxID=240206 RepID=UPI0005286F44
SQFLQEPDYNYRAEVKKLIPHLEYLDEIPASQTALPPSKKMHEDWLIIKEGGLAGDISWLDPYLGAVPRQSGCSSRPLTTSSPGTAQRSANAGTSTSACLLSGGHPHPDPTVSDGLFTEDDSSDLTHGLCQVICGNPTKALRARRQKLGPPAVSPLKLCGLRAANLCGSGGGGDLHQEDVFSGLKVRQEQHKWCLQKAQQEEAAQALKGSLSDEEEGEDCSLMDGCEDLRETCDEDLIERISLGSSCHSCLSQSSSGSSQAQEGAVLSNPDCCLIPSPLKTPASGTGVAARPWKMRNHRVRCLKIPSQEENGQWTERSQSRAQQEASAQPPGKERALLSQDSVPAAARSRGQRQPAGSTGRQRPVTEPGAVGSASARPVMDETPPGEINSHRPALCSSTDTLERFRLKDAAWPLTARATLQALPDRPAVPTA